MAIAQIGTVTAFSAGASVTSPSLNTSGATLLIITVGDSTAIGSITVSDSNGNSWHARQNQSGIANMNGGMLYAFDKSGSALVTGSGHTVTVSGTTFPAITFSAFTGTLANNVDPYDSTAGESGGTNNAGTTVQPGSITAISGSLVVTAYGNANTTNASIAVTSPYILIGSVAGVAGTNYGVGVAFSTSVTTTNPTWTTGISGVQVATIASFKAAPVAFTGAAQLLPILTINPIRPISGPYAAQSGAGTLSQVALLSQGITNPQQLSMIMFEAIQGLQDQIQTLYQLLGIAPTVNQFNIPQALPGPNGTIQVNILWASQNPGAHQISWGGGSISYQGVTYSIAAGNASNISSFIYWQLSNPTILQSSTGLPPNIGADDFVVALNAPDGSGPGNLGTYSPVIEMHNANNDRLVLSPGLLSAYGYGNKALVLLGTVNTNTEIAAAPYGDIRVLYNGNTGTSAAELSAALGVGTLNLVNTSNASSQVNISADPSIGAYLSLSNSDGTTAFAISAGHGGQTSATAGTHGAVPAQVAGYYTVAINSVNQKIPYFNV
jgi:hypothetical protein